MTDALAGKVALVTGGGQGLGFDIAHAFADAGMKLVITGRVQEKLDARAEELHAEGAEVLAVAGDVSVRATADDAVARTLDAFGRLDVLVNNAQTLSLPVPLVEQDDSVPLEPDDLRRLEGSHQSHALPPAAGAGLSPAGGQARLLP